MLKWRLLSAAVIIGLLVVLLHLDFHYPLLGVSGLWLLPLAVVASLLMVNELLDFWRQREDCPVAWPVYVAVPLVVVAAAAPQLWPLTGHVYPAHCVFGYLGWPLTAFTVGLMLAFVGEMRRYTEPGRCSSAIALSVLAMAYAGLGVSFLVGLRLLHGHQWGMVALLSVVIVTKISDTGAYFVGRRWGRHKLAPVLSPGKTREGALGGLAAAVLGAMLVCFVVVPLLITDGPTATRWPMWIAYALVVAVAGMLGDLAESLLKRDAQRKDSSRWLPGLGGVLDIFDSLLFASVPAYLFWASGLLGPG